MRVGDSVVVTDEYKTTNGELVGMKGRILRINHLAQYPIKVEFDNGNIEIFEMNELTKENDE